jgi:hypothetical protein
VSVNAAKGRMHRRTRSSTCIVFVALLWSQVRVVALKIAGDGQLRKVIPDDLECLHGVCPGLAVPISEHREHGRLVEH